MVLDNLPYYVGYAIGLLLAKIVEFGIKVWTWITTELPKIIQGIVDWFKKLPSKIWEAIKSAIEKLKEWATNMINTAKEEVPKIIDKIVEFFKELPRKTYGHWKKCY